MTHSAYPTSESCQSARKQITINNNISTWHTHISSHKQHTQSGIGGKSSAHLCISSTVVPGALGPTAFKNMPARNGRIIPGYPLMNPIRQRLQEPRTLAPRKTVDPLLRCRLLYSYCFTLRYKLRGGVYLAVVRITHVRQALSLATTTAN